MANFSTANNVRTWKFRCIVPTNVLKMPAKRRTLAGTREFVAVSIKIKKHMTSSKKLIPKIVLDVDGTLITTGKTPKERRTVTALLRAFHGLGWEIWVHSGGGVLYAKRWVEFLKLHEEMHINIAIKGDPKLHYDIAVDDCLDEEIWTSKKHGNYINAKMYINV